MTTNGNGRHDPDDPVTVGDELALTADELSGLLSDHHAPETYTARLIEIRDSLVDLLQEVQQPPPSPAGAPGCRTPPEKVELVRRMLSGGASIRSTAQATGTSRDLVRALVPEPPPAVPLAWAAGPLDQPDRPAKPRPLSRADQVEIRRRVRSGEARVVVAGDYNVSRDTLAVVLHEEDDP
jgi:hypothetical protein